jgi:hypothetical protein
MPIGASSMRRHPRIGDVQGNRYGTVAYIRKGETMARLSMRRLAVALLTAVATSVVALSPAAAANAAPAQQNTRISFTVQQAPTPASASEVGALQSSDFQVAAVNATGQNFDEVWLAYNRYSLPVSQVLTRRPFGNGQVQIFTIGTCSDVNQYALALVRGSSIIFNTGNIQRTNCNEIIQFS